MYQIMAEQESIFCNPAGREGAMASKIQPFIQRQHMIQPTYEIYHYRDTYPKEVALHHHDFYEMKCICFFRAVWIMSLTAATIGFPREMFC